MLLIRSPVFTHIRSAPLQRRFSLYFRAQFRHSALRWGAAVKEPGKTKARKDAAKLKFFDTSLSRELAQKKSTGFFDMSLSSKVAAMRQQRGGGENKVPVNVKTKNDVAPNSGSLVAAVQKLELERVSNAALSLLPLPPQPPTPTPTSAPKKKKKAKKTPNDHFHTRLRQVLLYYYYLLHTHALPASDPAKNFLSATPFPTAYALLAAAVHPAAKNLINTGRLLADYTRLPKDCLVPHQGCYINIITHPTAAAPAPPGAYIGGASSVSGKTLGVQRPLRGRLADPPYPEWRPGSNAGVGRRVAQHLATAGKGKVGTAHYRCMLEEGSRYDFRLLAAFRETVEAGAVWVLESFLVLELGTMPNKHGVASAGEVRYRGLNRRDPLVTTAGPQKGVERKGEGVVA